VSPDGAHVYAAAPGSRSHTLVAFARDSLTGLLTPVDVERNGVGGVEGLGSPEAVAMSPAGAHVYVLAGLELIAFTRDAATGTLTEIERDDVPGAGGPASLGLSPDATLVYAVGGVEESALAVFARDPGTGSLSLIEVEFDGQRRRRAVLADVGCAEPGRPARLRDRTGPRLARHLRRRRRHRDDDHPPR